MPHPRQDLSRYTILCIVDRRRNSLSRKLKHEGFTVLETFTADQAVALAASAAIDVVVLDQEFFVETDGWSVAQSLKLVKPNICVLLASRAIRLTNVLPAGVDAVVSSRDPQRIIETVYGLVLPMRTASGS